MTTTTRTITRTAEAYPGETEPRDCWAVAVDGQRVSTLYLDVDSGEILNVETEPAHRGQGHATALYRAAISVRPVFHAPVSHRTDDGAGFAARVGGPELPPCTTCCAFLDEE